MSKIFYRDVVYPDILKEIRDELMESIKILQTIDPKFSISSNLFATTMNLHFNDEIVFTCGEMRVNGFVLGIITTYQIQQKI